MARKILIALFIAHAVLLLVPMAGRHFVPPPDPRIVALLVLNLLALGGLATRLRAGWLAAMLFIAAGVAHYAFTLGVDGASLAILLGIAGAVWCIADPVLRREHGIPA